MRQVLRGITAVVGALLAVSLLGSPALADDLVPSGCVGVEVYVCTGGATPFEEKPPVYLWPWDLTYDIPQTPLLPGATVQGRQIGGVAVVLGGQSVEGFETQVDLTGPVETGIVTPVGICAFVACYPAGTPIDVPGLPLPVVPVVVPGITVPTETVNVPTVATVPTTSAPGVSVPATHLDLTLIAVYSYRDEDVRGLARLICETGGGSFSSWFSIEHQRYRYACARGTEATTLLANILLAMAGMG